MVNSSKSISSPVSSFYTWCSVISFSTVSLVLMFMVLVAKSVSSSRTSSSSWYFAITVVIFLFVLLFTSSLSITVSYPSSVPVSSLWLSDLHSWLFIWWIVVLSHIWSLSSVSSSVSVSFLYFGVCIWVVFGAWYPTCTFSSFLPYSDYISSACLSPIFSLSSEFVWIVF